MSERIISLLLVMMLLAAGFSASAEYGCRHNYETKVVEPTCTEAGYSTGTCTECGDTWVDPGRPAKGHSFSWTVIEATCTEDGSKTGVCDRCGHTWTGVLTANGHKWTPWAVDTEATPLTPGRRERHCTVCGLTEYEYFTAIGEVVEGCVWVTKKLITGLSGEDPVFTADRQLQFEVTVTNITGKPIVITDVRDRVVGTEYYYTVSGDATGLEADGSWTKVFAVSVSTLAPGITSGLVTDCVEVNWSYADGSEGGVEVSNSVTVRIEENPVTVTKRLVTDIPEDERAFYPDEPLEFEVTVTNTSGRTIVLTDINDVAADNSNAISLAECCAEVETGYTFSFSVTADALFPGRTEGIAADYIDAAWVYADSITGGYAVSNTVNVPLKGYEALSVRKVPVGFDPDTAMFTQWDEVSFDVYVKNNSAEEIPGFSLFDYIVDTDTYYYIDTYGVLAPGEEAKVGFSWYVTGKDCARGYVTDIAAVFIEDGREEFAPEDAFLSGKVTIFCGQTAPAITLEKSVLNLTEYPAGYAEGDTIEYRFTVTNASEDTVYSAALSDDYIGTGADLGSIAPGETVYADFSYTVTKADCECGSVYNAGVLQGSWQGDDFSIVSNPVTVPAIQAEPEPEPVAALAVDKQVISTAAAADGRYVAGEPVVYLVTVTNTGDVTLGNITVVDVILLSTGLDEINKSDSDPLVPGESRCYSFVRPVDYADCGAGYVTDSAYATAYTPDARVITQYSDDCTVYTKTEPGEVQETATLTKYEISTPKHAYYTEGEHVTFCVVFYNNTGWKFYDLSIYDILSDNGNKLIATESSVEPNEYVMALVDYEVTKTDVEAGSVTNIAWASARNHMRETEYFYSNEVTVPCGRIPDAVPSCGSSCIKTLVASDNGSELVRTDLCAAHYVLELKEQALENPDEIVSMWMMNVITMYSALSYRTGSDAIAADRDMFLAEISSLTESLGADGTGLIISILRERATELCYEMSGLERRDDMLSPQTKNTLAGLAGTACEYAVRTGSAAWYQTCASAAGTHLMTQNRADSIIAAIKDNSATAGEGLSKIGTLWTAALSGEYARLAKQNPAFASGMALYTPAIQARKNALNAVYPGNPELVSGLIAREIRNRTLLLCEYEAAHR